MLVTSRFSPSVPTRYIVALVAALGASASWGAAASAQPYPYYPALDLNRIPFHTSSGAWGAQTRIAVPQLPRITSHVTAYSAAEFSRLIANNRRITIAPGVVVPSVNLQNRQDIEIVIRNGARIQQMRLGNTRRLYIHGDVIGRRNSGRIDYIDAGYSGIVTDLVIDGLDSSPTNYARSMLIGTTNPLVRVSITNMRVKGGIGLWGGGASDVVIAGNNMYNPSGWWTWRIHGTGTFDRLVMFRNFMATTSQPVLRLHRPAKMWLSENTFVNSTQLAPGSTGFVLRFNEAFGGAVWIERTRVHAQGTLGAECHPAFPNQPRFFRFDGTNQMVADRWSGGPRPGPGDNWVLTPQRLGTAGNPVPGWNHRNASGDPRQLP